MVDRKFCDKCNKETTKDVQYEAEIYDVIAENDIVKVDLCEKCMKELKEHFPKNK